VNVSIATFSNAPDLKRTQPINFVSAAAPPIFLATGDADTTVYPKNTHVLAARLRAAGSTVVEKTYAGLDHVDTLLSLSTVFRGKAPVLSDIVNFIASVDQVPSLVTQPAQAPK
jgi:acetyl esterase/lipase